MMVPVWLEPYAAYAKVAKLAAIVGIMVATWCHGCHQGVISEQRKSEAALSTQRAVRIAAYEKQIGDARVLAAEDQSRAAILASKLIDVLGERDTLQSLTYAMTSAKKEKPNADGTCTTRILSDTFGMCLTAAVSGTAADFAACEAGGGHDAGTATSGQRSVPLPIPRIDSGSAGGAASGMPGDAGSELSRPGDETG